MLLKPRVGFCAVYESGTPVVKVAVAEVLEVTVTVYALIPAKVTSPVNPVV